MSPLPGQGVFGAGMGVCPAAEAGWQAAMPPGRSCGFNDHSGEYGTLHRLLCGALVMWVWSAIGGVRQVARFVLRPLKRAVRSQAESGPGEDMAARGRCSVKRVSCEQMSWCRFEVGLASGHATRPLW